MQQDIAARRETIRKRIAAMISEQKKLEDAIITTDKLIDAHNSLAHFLGKDYVDNLTVSDLFPSDYIEDMKEEITEALKTGKTEIERSLSPEVVGPANPQNVPAQTFIPVIPGRQTIQPNTSPNIPNLAPRIPQSPGYPYPGTTCPYIGDPIPNPYIVTCQTPGLTGTNESIISAQEQNSTGSSVHSGTIFIVSEKGK